MPPSTQAAIAAPYAHATAPLRRLVDRWSLTIALAGAVAVMAAQVDRCTVDGEEVVPQPGGFYGGWITDEIVGPFKGPPGTRGW